MESARTVLITGGNRGIGFAIAEEFLASGYQVAVKST
ncbi:SDR family NAD(P)-dependent oxidoreductase [Aquiluna sp.]|nr:SDR family NAD(P)-dependent oxidoreductase [Aquiluna sp.]MDA8992818.1 SDR family NAD(P)-dependent oxidoreductase [Aquiluna sp.]